jgi:O-Antigen ligase
MLQTRSKNSISRIPDFQLTNLTFAEKVIYWTIVLTPLWWVLGIQPIFYPFVAAILLVLGFDIDNLTKASLPWCNLAWLGMVLAVLITNILGLSERNFDILKTFATLFTIFKGYFLIFSCMTLPFWHSIRINVIVRAVAWMCVGSMVVLGIQLLILAALGPQESFLPPLARLIPGEKASLMLKFAIIQPFFGISLPRTDLYTPDPPILGVFALLCFFICLGETNSRLRKFALTGCIVSLIISQSRLAWICFPLAFIIIACFHSGLARQSYLWIASFTSLFCAKFGLTIQDLISKPLESFNSARADSSKDRELVVSATIDAWKESPWLGWGVMDKSFIFPWGNGDVQLPLGTFSSYAQVLYLHGVFGFTFFIISLISTLYTFGKPAIRGNRICQQAFASLIALYLLCQATNLSWMAIYFWFYFIWLGAIISDISKKRSNIINWKQLAL